MPRRFAGHRGLELCNTWAGWGLPPEPEREWLADYDRLAVWSGHVELVDVETVEALRASAADDPSWAERVLAEVRTLRTALHTVLADETRSDAFDVVAAFAGRAMAALELVDDDVGGRTGRTARWRLPASLGLELPLLAAARSAADLLTGPDRGRVRSCPGDDCGWMFIDRRGRRRWCSMEVCGNRAKVRAHAARSRRSAS